MFRGQHLKYLSVLLLVVQWPAKEVVRRVDEAYDAQKGNGKRLTTKCGTVLGPRGVKLMARILGK